MNDSEHPHDDAARRGKTPTYDTCIEGETFPNNHQATTDKSIIVTALHEWSAGAIFEDQGIKLTRTGFAPTFATEYEQKIVLKILKEGRNLIIPITNEIPSNPDKSSPRKKPTAMTNLRLHVDAKETYSINKKTPPINPESAHQLWVFCATEDCMAYFHHKLIKSSFPSFTRQFPEIRPLISESITFHLSPAQVWRAIWMAITAESNERKNSYKSSEESRHKTCARLDMLLRKAIDNESFPTNMRENQAGAIIKFLQKTFNFNNLTQGWEVREIMMENSNHTSLISKDESPPCY